MVGNVEAKAQAGKKGKTYDLKRFNLHSDGTKHVQCVIWGITQINKLEKMIIDKNVSIGFFSSPIIITHNIKYLFCLFKKIHIQHAQAKEINSSYYRPERGAVRQELHIVDGTTVTSYGQLVINVPDLKLKATPVDFNSIAEASGLVGEYCNLKQFFNSSK